MATAEKAKTNCALSVVEPEKGALPPCLPRYRQKRSPAGNWVDRSTCNLSSLIDIFGLFEPRRVIGRFKIVKVLHDAVFPDESAAIDEVCVARKADDLTLFVNAVGFAVHVSGQRPERLNATLLGPDESVQEITLRKCRIAREADDDVEQLFWPRKWGPATATWLLPHES